MPSHLDYHAPFRIESPHASDAPILAQLAPGTRPDLHRAAGVATDLAKRVTGPLSIRDSGGIVVPEAVWRPLIAAARAAAEPRTAR